MSNNGSSRRTSDNNPRTSFKIRLYNDFKERVIVPKLPNLCDGSRWILITTRNNETYKVEMADEVGAFELKRGWSLLAATQNLQEGERLLFQIQGDNQFAMSIHSPSNHPPVIGFSQERIPPVPLENVNLIPAMFNHANIMLNPDVEKAIQRVWNASSVNGTVYVCRLLISPTKGNCFIFNKPYSSLIPKKHGNIAMRFVGSNIIIPGAIKTYTDGNARMVKDWHLYTAEHNLTEGEVFACKIHRGPAVWEFIGSCAR